MNLPDVPFLSMLREKMSWLSARQSVLSENVANADVSGYQARDLKALDFEQMLKDTGGVHTVRIAITDPRHIPSSQADPTSFTDDDTVTPGGNVSAEQEMLKVSDTQMQYQAASNLYAKSIQMMRTAIDANH